MTRIAPASRVLEVLATDVEGVVEEAVRAAGEGEEVSRVKTRQGERVI